MPLHQLEMKKLLNSIMHTVPVSQSWLSQVWTESEILGREVAQQLSHTMAIEMTQRANKNVKNGDDDTRSAYMEGRMNGVAELLFSCYFNITSGNALSATALALLEDKHVEKDFPEALEGQELYSEMLASRKAARNELRNAMELLTSEMLAVGSRPEMFEWARVECFA
jgi:hypothetical protein